MASVLNDYGDVDAKASQDITFSDLVPGDAYLLEVTSVRTSLATPEVESFTYFTLCGCDDGDDTETTGQPKEFTTRQSHGFVYFTWRDYSECEFGFMVTREGTEEQDSFGGEYAVAMPEECYMRHEPTSLRDSVEDSELVLGQTYRYCIIAYRRDFLKWWTECVAGSHSGRGAGKGRAAAVSAGLFRAQCHSAPRTSPSHIHMLPPAHLFDPTSCF